MVIDFFRTEAKEAEQDTHSVDVLADPTSQLDHSGWSSTFSNGQSNSRET